MEQLIIITGLSGSGKTLAADCFEDMGYFCVDNLPVSLIPRFCELIRDGQERIQRAALVIDAREGSMLESFPRILQQLRDGAVPVQLLFFDCEDDVLKRRFSESRRPHPMSAGTSTLKEAIDAERQALRLLRELADRRIDTSSFTAHQLREFLKNAYENVGEARGLRVNLTSFGYKHGVPAEADLVFDVRFLPNPHFVEELRPLDGRNPRIQEFLNRSELTGNFLERLQGFLEYLLPHYREEGKAYLTVAIGCTGGKHRSVALAEALGAGLGGTDLRVSIRHRDLGRE